MTARDFAVDATTGDLQVFGDTFVFASDLDAIAQDLRLRLGFFLGEWFLDTTVGVDYFGDILVKDPNMAKVREWFRRTIAETEGVREILQLDLAFSAPRVLTVTFRVSTDLGEIASSVTT